MSRPSWQTSLQAALKRRTAIFGVGHDLRGDDAVGLVVIRALQDHRMETDRFMLLDAGPSPENFTGRLRDFKPETVLFIDAAEMDAEPGDIRWLSWQDVTGLSASTHTLPLSVLTKYLMAEYNCEVAMLGIQPAGTLIDTPLSPAVKAAAESIVLSLIGD